MTFDTQMAAFIPRQWSSVLATRRNDTTRAIETLAQLCKPYRQPLYAYVRLRGHTPDEARALTGEFLARLLQNKTLAYMKRDCGKLRSFLLTALNRFLLERRQAGPPAPADVALGEPESGELEKVFEHNWALAILNIVYDRLKSEYEQAGQSDVFVALKFCLAGASEALPWRELSAGLGVDESSVKTLVQNLRRRYAELLREEVSQVVATPADFEEELRSLFPPSHWQT